MNTFSEEQKGFVIESLKAGMGIGHIVDDLIEIYGIEVDADGEVREKLYRRVQKVKSKLKPAVASKTGSDDVADEETAADILPTVSPQWRVSYLRALLREAGGDVSLKVRLLREIRVEEQLIREARADGADKSDPLLNAMYMQALRQQALGMAIHKVKADKALSELTGHEGANIDHAVGFLLGDPTRFMTEAEAEMYEFFKPFWELGMMYRYTVIDTEAYDEIEAGEVYERKCDGVRVDSLGKPLTPGEKSDSQWRQERDEQEQRDYYVELSEMDPEALKAYLYEVGDDMNEEKYQQTLDDIAAVLSEISAEEGA